VEPEEAGYRDTVAVLAPLCHGSPRGAANVPQSANDARCVTLARAAGRGVKPQFQHTGVAAAHYKDVWDACQRRGITRAETGWILEVNEPMNRAMQALTGTIVKRYRIYERTIEAGGGSSGRGRDRRLDRPGTE
jgi:hypothetical protein